MNYLDFFASVIKSITSLAWPVAVVVSVWIFRNDLRPLLPRMRFRHKDTEFSFRLDEVEKVVESLPAITESAPATPEEISNFERIARASPRSALLEMRREIEDVLKKHAEAQGYKTNWMTSPRAILRRLRERDDINSTAASLLDEVLTLGNVAAHDTNAVFSFEDAMRYRSVVDHAIRILDEPHPARTETDVLAPSGRTL
ncbi:DUF4145 domain-containing protein [Rhizobium sp. S96]|uniref:DUF4145 domain-containing protein n=1 Tax=Rhizobium sp. S96 TaxID=3055140 RepID=UPI0025AB1580|nr:DUF4145 domain-containing protein [Rhizobium sp. S96]MDM9622637.1 DUF4145 domain-containing protein [Rhizobium sp. S96]